MAIKHGLKMAAAAGCLAFLATGTSALADTETLYRQAAEAHYQRDFKRSIPLWQALAERGVVNAQYNLGQIYYYGDGVPQDFALAMKWLKRAGEQGDKASQILVGSMYQRGDGISPNPEEAHRWFVMNRQHHRHHGHDPKMAAWREQAAGIIWQRDMTESLAHSRQSGQQVLAELQRRAAASAVASAVPDARLNIASR